MTTSLPKAVPERLYAGQELAARVAQRRQQFIDATKGSVGQTRRVPGQRPADRLPVELGIDQSAVDQEMRNRAEEMHAAGTDAIERQPARWIAQRGKTASVVGERRIGSPILFRQLLGPGDRQPGSELALHKRAGAIEQMTDQEATSILERKHGQVILRVQRESMASPTLSDAMARKRRQQRAWQVNLGIDGSRADEVALLHGNSRIGSKREALSG